MIHEVDDSLRLLIEREALNGSDVEIVFDAPTSEWSARRNAPTVNAFLYDIREDLKRRDVGPQPVRNADGQVVDRRPPPRRFKLSYLLTAWTQRPEDEHRLLSQLLSCFIQYDELPEEVLPGALVDLEVPVLVTLALPPPQDRSLSDIWSALGGELKPSLDLVVVAPLEAGRSFETGPPVLEEPRIRVSPGAEGEPVTKRAGRKRKGSASRPASVDAPDRPGAETIQVGTDEHPGRTVTFAARDHHPRR